MQHHTVQQLESGPRAGKWIYTGGNRRMGRYAECCSEAWLEMLETPTEQRDTSPAWDRIGHDTPEQAYAHQRAKLLNRLELDRRTTNWGGCWAPGPDGARCDAPTKNLAAIEPLYFLKHLCDEHLTREVVEQLWSGPGNWSGSW